MALSGASLSNANGGKSVFRACPKCGSVADYDSYFEAWICTRSDCDFFEVKRKTNRDWLNSMSTLAIGGWIESIADCERCKLPCRKREGYPVSPAICALHWRDWLDSEVEDDKVR